MARDPESIDGIQACERACEALRHCEKRLPACHLPHDWDLIAAWEESLARIQAG